MADILDRQTMISVAKQHGWDTSYASLKSYSLFAWLGFRARPTGGPRLVILESPYAGDVERNVAYARECLRDSLRRGEAPIASHLLYTQVLDDTVPEQRQQGIEAGLAWKSVAQASVIYADLGISKGMEYGIAAAMTAGLPLEYRRILQERKVA